MRVVLTWLSSTTELLNWVVSARVVLVLADRVFEALRSCIAAAALGFSSFSLGKVCNFILFAED